MLLLTKANADLEQFAYSASHDLREPIRMVASTPSFQRRSIEVALMSRPISTSTSPSRGPIRMNLMIDDLLAYTRSSAHPDEPVSSISAIFCFAARAP